MNKEKFIDIRRLIASKNPKLLKFLPNFIVKYLEKILHQEEINKFLEDNPTLKNQEFCAEVIKYFNIKVKVEGLEKIPKTGTYTIAMNHPLGGMDAIAFVSALKDYRTDIKYIVNDILMNIEPLKDLFVGVNKHGKNNTGIHQKIDDLFASDNLICIFPAGLVSRKTKGKVRDLIWKKTFVTLTKKNNNPIIPIFIDGKLSNFFYRLSNFRKFLGIKANFEMLYLSNELFKQRNQTITFKIGDIIYPESITEDKSYADWAEVIKNKVYELDK